jgi:tape measure domain-containing protein
MATVQEHILLLTDRFTKGMKDAESATSSMESTFGGLTQLVAGLGIGFGVASLTKEIFSLGIEAEQTKTSFGVMLGGIGNANKMLGDLAEFANVTPFDNKAVEDSAKVLLQFGIAGDDVIPTMRMLGDASGGNAEKLSQMTLAFAQLTSAGKLQGQDLLQLINAGFNPLKEISERTGESMGSLRKKMESGAISADMVKESFQNATGAGGMFFGMMDKQSQTVGGRISTLLGTLQELGKVIGTALLPVLGGITDALQAVVGFVTNNIDAIKILTVALGVWGVAFGIATIWTNAFAISIGLASGAFTILNFIMSLNPIGRVIGLVVGLIAVFAILWQKSDGFRAFMLGVWASVKQLFSNIVDTFKRIPDIVIGAVKGVPLAIWNALKDVGGLLKAIFTGDFKAIPDLLAKLGDNLIKANPFLEVGRQIGNGLTAGMNDAFKGAKFDELEKVYADGVINGTRSGVLSLQETQKSFSPLVLASSMSEKSMSAKSPTAGGRLGSTGSKSSSLGSGLSEIKAGSPKVFNINIEKLVEKIDLKTSTLTESTVQIKEMVTKVLLQAINDTQIISE